MRLVVKRAPLSYVPREGVYMLASLGMSDLRFQICNLRFAI